MNEPDISKADFTALRDLADSKFYAWHRREIRPEWNSRIRDLKRKNLTCGGRAISAMQIRQELSEREVRERIRIYAEVAHEFRNAEMLSKPRLEEFRERIMTTVGHAIAALKGDIERDARATGDLPESALPHELRYIQLQAEILDVVIAELRVLEAEGKLAGPANRTEAILEDGIGAASTMPVMLSKPQGKGQKRGPKPGYEMASKVAEIVERVAPVGGWRSKLDDICEALDEEKIPCPPTWRRRDQDYRCWTTTCAAEPQLVIKAIEYRRTVAKQQKKLTPETLS